MRKFSALALSVVIYALSTLPSAMAADVAPPVRDNLGGLLNDDTDDTVALTPGGDTVFFDRSIGNDKSIMIAHKLGGRWSTPQVAPFSGHWFDQDPVVAPDGSFMVFSSNRPIKAGGEPITQNLFGRPQPGGNLWRVARKGAGWGEAEWLGAAVNENSFTVFPSIAGDGSLYFIHWDQGAMHIYRSQYQDGRYQPPTRVVLGDPQVTTHDPAVALDESFILFDYGKTKPGLGRLSIAFKEGDHWSKPMDLGDTANQDQPWGPHLSPDHHTVYFNGTTHLWSFSLAPILTPTH